LKDDDNDALTVPLCVSGTAEELDRDLARQVREFAEAQATTSSNLAQVKKELEASEKAAREEARKKTAKGKATAIESEKRPDDQSKAAEPPSVMSLFESEPTAIADENKPSPAQIACWAR